jgi:hypothetical protein
MNLSTFFCLKNNFILKITIFRFYKNYLLNINNSYYKNIFLLNSYKYFKFKKSINYLIFFYYYNTRIIFVLIITLIFILSIKI